jgi:hypothetical protein
MVDEGRFSPMIIRMAKHTVYYLATKKQATDLLGSALFLRCPSEPEKFEVTINLEERVY